MIKTKNNKKEKINKRKRKPNYKTLKKSQKKKLLEEWKKQKMIYKERKMLVLTYLTSSDFLLTNRLNIMIPEKLKEWD